MQRTKIGASSFEIRIPCIKIHKMKLVSTSELRWSREPPPADRLIFFAPVEANLIYIYAENLYSKNHNEHCTNRNNK